ncbi:MAG: hypothetical protein EXR77_20405 [Myxococcales bacterium]|nr:hypothetical protein [Myxococcales bacterium]
MAVFWLGLEWLGRLQFLSAVLKAKSTGKRGMPAAGKWAQSAIPPLSGGPAGGKGGLAMGASDRTPFAPTPSLLVLHTDLLPLAARSAGPAP